MEKKVQEFLNEAITERKKSLMGLSMDLAFFDIMLEKYPEESLREELKKENEKVLRDEKNERIIEDNRDMEKIAKLEKMIAKSQKIKAQKDQYTDGYQDMLEYIAFIERKDGKLISKLDEINNK